MSPITPHQKFVARLILSNSSIIDTHGLCCSSYDDVDRILKVNGFNWDSSKNRERLVNIQSEAVGYVESFFLKRLDDEIRRPKDIRDLFLIASEKKGSDACLLLKIINTINHIDGYELFYSTPVSFRNLCRQVDDKIGGELSHLKGSGFPIVSFKGGRKPKSSLVTKVLSKKSALTSAVNNRFRYQIVTEKKEDLAVLLISLFDTVLPFNYVIPGATKNQLIDLRPYDDTGQLAKILSYERSDYTGDTYKVLKFMVDVPVRVDPQSSKWGEDLTKELGENTFVMVSIEMLDLETLRQNEEGENAHRLYKDRQREGTLRRIT